MLSALLLSKNLDFAAKFQSFFNNLGYLHSTLRIKHALSIEDAKSWLTLSSYNVIFIDDSYEYEQSVSFLLESWSQQPLSVSAYISEKEASDEIKKLFRLGLESCAGVDCFHACKKLIDRMPVVLDTLTMSHQGVLVLDDLDSPRDIICSLIQSLGFSKVSSSAKVDDAISLLIKNPFDYFCVVCDINMPEKSGIHFIRELRRTLSLAYLPVIVLTSDPNHENLIMCLKEGITAFLAKPPPKKVLKAELQKAKRIVGLGKDPLIGTAEEIRLLEQVIKQKK